MSHESPAEKGASSKFGNRALESFKRLDAGFVIVLGICLLAIWPFVSRPSLPQATDAELHIYRLAELSRVVREGELYPRWAPNFYYGYGYPIFNYYAPLAYYVALPMELLPLIGPVQAVKAVFMLSLLLAGVGIYGYVRDLWGRVAGLVAAAAYVYAPYVLFVDPHARGDLAEALSFAVFPLALWSLDRLRRRPSTLNWIASVGLVAGLVLSHNLMSVVFWGLLLAWAVWQEIVRGTPRLAAGTSSRLDGLIRYRLFLALALGLGSAAFFWLPVALESAAVDLQSLIGDGGHFDYRNHFLSVRELLSQSHLLDWGASEPEFALNLGVAQWLLAALGILTLLAKRAKRERQALFFALAMAIMVFLMLAASEFLWDAVPLLPYMQFPWRLLGPTAAAAAILGGVGIAALQKMLPDRSARILPAASIGLIIFLALPLVQLPPWPEDFGPTSALRVLEEELAGRWLGTTSTADFVPATVDIVPKPAKTLIEDFRNQRPLDRVNRDALPESTEVLSEQNSPLRYTYLTKSESDFRLRLFLFEFPGWKAFLDGEAIEPELGRPEGFIVIPVPAGEHAVEVEFGATPPRTLGLLASIFSWLSTILVATGLASIRRREPRADTPDGPVSRQLGLTEALVLGVALLLVAGNVALVEPRGLLRIESEGLIAEPAEFKVYGDFGGQIFLVGLDIPDKMAPAGREIEVTAYWIAQTPLDINYQSFLHLLDGDGKLVAQVDKLNPGEFPTKRWPTDKYIRDSYRLALPADLPEGEYRLSIGLWVAGEGWRLPLIDERGEQISDSYQFAQPLVVD
jgi:hypothetical protein